MDWYYDMMDAIAERLEALPRVIVRTVTEPQFHMSEAILLTAIVALLVIVLVLAILYRALGPGKPRKVRDKGAPGARRHKRL